MGRGSLISTFREKQAKSTVYEFDVFLAHNAGERAEVECAGDDLSGGDRESSATNSDNRGFVGKSGMRPWEKVKIRLAIS